ncbi:MAG: hypothetical protein KDC66_03360 [Phaeodactylibacter sp.]|nr:hypothetical protein [Phaeodactylibacter sp.]MCB9273967.1 hypothetical protein [Lewinellaceae bacterium]
MKNITTHLALVQAILLLFVSVFAYGQEVEKTLVKSFNLEGNQAVTFDVPGAVELQTWNNNYLRVQIQVSLENGSEALLKSLVQAGRYNLRSEEKDGAYTIVAPDLGREVRIGGKPIVDKVSFLIHAPENVLVKMPGLQENTVAEASSSF